MTPPDRLKRELQQAIELQLASTTVDVLVMGPTLTVSSPASTLRAEIIQLANGFGAAIKPEHVDLIAAATEKLGDGDSLTAYERFLVDMSHLVVLIPASAGSLCELGLFSAFESSARKLLILQSLEWDRSGNYVADGSLKIAVNNGAEVHYVDYNDVDAAWTLVRHRMERIKVDRSMVHLSGE